MSHCPLEGHALRDLPTPTRPHLLTVPLPPSSLWAEEQAFTFWASGEQRRGTRCHDVSRLKDGGDFPGSCDPAMATSGQEDRASQWSERTREGHGRFHALKNSEQLSWLQKIELVHTSAWRVKGDS